MDTTLLKRRGDAGADRRSDERRRVFLFGRLSDRTGEKAVECAIANVSHAGAQVRLYGEIELPNEAYLIDANTHSAHLANIVWREDDRLGLSFVATYNLEKPLPPKLNFLNCLFVETKLRQLELLESLARAQPPAQS
jgi:hypothetical protein